MKSAQQHRAAHIGKLALALVLSTIFTTATAAERKDFGWGGTGGGNLEAYGINHDQIDRQGDFVFVYGGAPDSGDIRYMHFDGSAWINNIVIDPSGNLDVRGRVRASEIVVEEASGWPDYVFSSDYQSKSLAEIESFIQENNHLPGFPSAQEIYHDGHNIAEINKLLLRHSEELTLHTIELMKENRSLEERIEKLESLVLTEAGSK